MKEELSFLRRKVNRLEDMIFNINDKIGLILEKFLNHRAGQVADIREVLQTEEDLCVSLVGQLKSCIINTCDGNRSAARTSDKKGNRTPVPKVPIPTKVSKQSTNSSRQNQSQSQPTRTSTRLSASNSATKNESSSLIERSRHERSERMEAELQSVEIVDNEENELSMNVKAEEMEFTPAQEFLTDSFLVGDSIPDCPEPEGGDEDPGEDSVDNETDDDVDETREDEGEDPEFLPSNMKTSGSKTLKKQPWAKKLERSFTSLDEAKAHIKAEKNRVIRNTRYTTTGTHIHLMCKGFPKCPARMVHIVDDKTGKVDEYISVGIEHEHRPKNRQLKVKLPQEIEDAIEDIYLGGVRGVPNIHQELARRGKGDIPKFRIYCAIQKLSQRRYGDLSFMRKTNTKPSKRKSDSQPNTNLPL